MKFNSKAIKLMAATLGATTLGVMGVTATAHADEIYTVQPGDTLSAISYKYSNDISMVNTIANKNKISDINFIVAGQKLYISNGGQIKQATPQEVATTPAANQSTATSTTSQSATTATSATTSVATVASSATATSTQPASSATTQSAVASTQPASSATTQSTTARTTTAPRTTQQSTAPAARRTTPQSATTTTSTTSGTDASAKAWIASHESGGSYSARNGQYIGKYQLSASYLGGDYSAANQEKVANSYVSSRYGSWSAAKAHWQNQGWY